MMHALALALTSVLLLPGLARSGLVDHVNPFIGTGGHGHTFPGPTLPFGMVQLSPDTRLTGWDGCSGYHYSDDVIYGFSHTHLSGTGVSDYGDILLMPVTGEPLLENGYPDRVDDGYGSRFDKSSERASAGYYTVHLQDYGVDVELTATPRTGLHRYVFPEGRPAHVIVDLVHRDRVLKSAFRVVDDRTIEGFRRSTAWARDQVVFFRARFSRPFTAAETFGDNDDGSGVNVKGVLSFGDGGGVLIIQVAISAVDLDGARRNLEDEWADFDFSGTHERARATWGKSLERFSIEGATDDERTVFATALYHSFLAPNLFVDSDGRYRGMDFAIHHAERRDHYTVFSLWDTYRATHPLFTLVERKRTNDFIQTFLAQYEQGGRLPVWELAANETDCMIGYHSVSVIADAYLKGIDDYDAERALEAMVRSATLDHFGLDAYRRDGFIGADEEGESVSKTLEYAYDDACIARMAEAMGHTETAREFARRSQAWRHLLDPQTRFFRPRRHGQWMHPYDPRRVDFHHTEANGWQYRFAAPHHAREHVKAIGGDDAFEAALDSLFAIDSATTGREQADITGRIGQYAHGNEPSHHVAWLSHFTGRPERSVARVSQILDEFYAATPEGLIGNEDCGQMSSWYVLASLGLYDVAPTSKQWLVIPPKHERMSVRFEDGRTLTTRRVGTGHIERVTFNGETLERSFLWHEEVLGGGELVFELGEAKGDWGESPSARPGTASLSAPIVPAPWAEAESDRFRGSLQVRLASGVHLATVRWTDSAELDPVEGAIYDGPIRLDSTTVLHFVAIDGDRTSPVVTARFDAIEHDWRVEVSSVPNGQYTAGGSDALIDGRRGPEDWRTGAWQGYQDQDFVATLDLGEPIPVTRAGASFLQDMRSWIWMPTELVVEVSEDGRSFVEAGRATHDVPDDVEGVFLRDFEVELDGRPIRALRVRAVNYGTIPTWHPGAGGQAFIFVDELIVQLQEP
jgi:predicted alpha-1,2-mannosidase